MVCKIHTLHSDVIIVKFEDNATIMKKYAKFQFDSISSSKVIEDLKTHKNAFIFVSHVSQESAYVSN